MLFYHRMKVFIRFALFTVLSVCAVSSVYTHPHTFIDTKVECEFDSEGLKGFWINWTFDPMFTSQLLMDYDLDRNNSFSKDEVLDVEENAFSNLINYYYFVYITENKKTFRPEEVTDFNAEITGNDIIYRFFIPYSSKAEDKTRKIILAIYDDTFFCDIALLSVKNIENSFSEAYDIKLTKRKNKEKTITYDNSFQSVTRDGAVYSGFVNPDELVIELRKK